MTYKNHQYRNDRNASGPRYQGPHRSDAARYAQRNGANANGAQKHCPPCQCGAHGGLENSLFGIKLPGAQPAACQITIYALPAELLTGYETPARYDAANDTYGADDYGKKRAA